MHNLALAVGCCWEIYFCLMEFLIISSAFHAPCAFRRLLSSGFKFSIKRHQSSNLSILQWMKLVSFFCSSTTPFCFQWTFWVRWVYLPPLWNACSHSLSSSLNFCGPEKWEARERNDRVVFLCSSERLYNFCCDVERLWADSPLLSFWRYPLLLSAARRSRFLRGKINWKHPPNKNRSINSARDIA